MPRRLAALAIAGLILGTWVAGCSNDDTSPVTAPDALNGATSNGRGDVFVIVIDTLRRDALRTYDPLMPAGEAFDDLARDAVVFDDLRSGTSWTRPAVASLLTGQHAHRHGIHGRRDLLPAAGPNLVVRMREAGYGTFAWSANPNILPVWGFDRGFDEFVDLGDGLASEPGRDRAPKPDGRDAFARVLAKVEASSAPGFYYVHVIDPHRPYRPPPEAMARVDAMRDAVRRTFPVPIQTPGTRIVWSQHYRRYVGEVIDVDAALGDFVAGLKRAGRYEAATLLVVSDHGEEFLEHGGEIHGQTLYEEVLRVPGLLKQAHGRDAGLRVTRRAELADLMPTLLAALGEAPSADSDGRDLLSADRTPEPPRFATLFLDEFRKAAVVDGSRKLVHDYAADRSELYDLAMDPEERRDLARLDPERVSEMRRLLERQRARHATGWHLRGCGCRDRTDAIEFALAGDTEQVSAIDFEPGDVHHLEGEVARYLMHLEPIAARTGEARGVREDHDELVVAARPESTTSDSPLRVGPARDGPFKVAFGTGPPRTRASGIELREWTREARVGASEPVDCHALTTDDATFDPGAGDLCEPHLRIWYVSAPDQPADPMDHTLQARLRALGYAE